MTNQLQCDVTEKQLTLFVNGERFQRKHPKTQTNHNTATATQYTNTCTV